MSLQKYFWKRLNLTPCEFPISIHRKKTKCSICLEEKFVHEYNLKEYSLHLCTCCSTVCKYKSQQHAISYLSKHNYGNPLLGSEHSRCSLCKGTNISKYKSCLICRSSKSKIRKFRKNNPHLLHGPCTICKNETKLVVDHCHRTGTLRNLLCTPCNITLGMAKDEPEIIMKCIEIWKPALLFSNFIPALKQQYVNRLSFLDMTDQFDQRLNKKKSNSFKF